MKLSVIMLLVFFTINAEISIDGKLVDSNSMPVKDATISIFVRGETVTAGQVSTDSGGYFAFEHFVADTQNGYVISVSGTTYPDQYWGIEKNTTVVPSYGITTPDGQSFTVLFKLDTNPSITSIQPNTLTGFMHGSVLNEDFIHPANINVTLKDSTGKDIITTVTDSLGEFYLPKVPANQKFFIELYPSSTTDPYPPQYSGITGTTTNPSKSFVLAPFTTLLLEDLPFSKNPSNYLNFNSTLLINVLDSAGVNAVTGNIEIAVVRGKNVFARLTEFDKTDAFVLNVNPWTYSIRVSADGYPVQYYGFNGTTLDPNEHVVINANDTLNLTLKLRYFNSDSGNINNYSGEIKGLVTNTSSKSLEHVEVVAINKNNNIGFLDFPYINGDFVTSTDVNGNYSLKGIPYGDWVVIFYSETDNYIPQIYNNTLNINDISPVSISETSPTALVNAQLKSGSTVTGYIKDGDLKSPVSGVYVELNSQAMYSFKARSDSLGRFVVKGVPAGTWYLNVWDQNGIYMINDMNGSDVKTDGVNNVILDADIVLEKASKIYGKVINGPTQNLNDNMCSIGRLFIYPKDYTGLNWDTHSADFQTSDTEETMGEKLSYFFADVVMEDSSHFKTSPIFSGPWKFVFSPNAGFDINQFLKSNKNCIPGYRWSYIDNEMSFDQSSVLTLTKGDSLYHDISLLTGGYSVKGEIVSEQGELIDMKTGFAHISVFIKDNGRLFRVSESDLIDSNRYVVSGLVEGEEYYIRYGTDSYPEQWYYTGTKGSTWNPDHASSVKFSTTSSTPLPKLILLKDPEGFNGWDDEKRPSEVSNFKITPVGFHITKISWSSLPDSEHIAYYRVYRLKNASDTLFTKTEYGWEPVNDSLLNSMLDSAVTKDTVYYDTTVEFGIKYMYVVAGINDSGIDGRMLENDLSLDKYFYNTDIVYFVKNDTLKKDEWSLSGIVGINSFDFSGVQDSLSPIVFKWDENTDSTKLYSHYVQPTKIVSGEGYWIYPRIDIVRQLTVDKLKSLAQKTAKVVVKLNKGWNQISSPYPYNVTPDFLTSAYPAYEWNGKDGYVKKYELSPWKGYWIYSDDTVSYEIRDISSILRRDAINRSRSGEIWKLRIALTGEDFSDRDNFIGVVPGTRSKPRLANPKPPEAFGTPSVSIVSGGDKYSELYRVGGPLPEDIMTWDLELSPSDKPGTLSFERVSVPKGLNLYYISDYGILNIADSGSISVPEHRETLSGVVVAASSAERLSMYLGKFAMRQNYPNPFKGVTTFEFTVPFNWNNPEVGNNVSLNVYNLSGRVVRKLVSKDMKFGIHKISWDGKDDYGIRLPAGLYIARIRGNGFSKSIKLVKMN